MIRKESAPDGTISGGLIGRWIELTATEIRRHRQFLTQLDAAIGDADHGVNMDRGFAAAVDVLQPGAGSSAGELLGQIAGTLLLRVGGAAGPLFGTAMRRMGAELDQVHPTESIAMASALRQGLHGIQQLGAAVLGDKTIVDAYAPAVLVFERNVRRGTDIASTARLAAEAADEGMRATIPMQARKGRASYLGARSIGHQDPGATSTALLFAALANALTEASSPLPAPTSKGSSLR
jgi:phosphoenolpyruvate---glycerone phosphotransferase subunit DhaL